MRNMRLRKIIFKRQSWSKWKKIKKKADVWRKPKGHNSKLRKKCQGYGKMPDPGYRVPKEIRYLHPKGKKEILVYNVEDLEKYNPEEYVVRIGGTVGRRKKILIYQRAKEKGFWVLNPPKAIEEKTGEE